MLKFIQSLFLLITLTGCEMQPPEPLRIGLNTWATYEFLYLADKKGFFKDENLDVKLIEFSSLFDAQRAYVRGQIDGLGTTVVDVLQMRDESPRSLQIVQVMDYSNGADMILSNANITKGKDLHGKKIGLELASLGIYILARGFDKFGLTLDDVQMQTMDQISLTAEFRKGTFDAIVTYAPMSIQLQRDTKANTLFSTNEISGEVVDVLAIDQAIIDSRPDDIEKLLRAYYRAVDYAQQNPDESYALMGAREGLTPQEFKEAITNGIQLVTQAEQNDFLKQGGKLETVVDMADKIMRKAGQIKGADYRAETITPRFAN